MIPCELSGHRGARAVRPENTLPGFLHAMALGVDTLELDVMLTADSRVVVTHDFILDPDLLRGEDGSWITSRVPTCKLFWRELRRFDVGRARPGSRTAKIFPRQVPCDGARIPLLEQVLELPAKLDIELKTAEHNPASCDPIALADRVLALLGDKRPAIRSFDFRGLRQVRAGRPDLAIAYLTEGDGAAALDRVLAEPRLPGDAWAPKFSTLSAELVARAQAGGLLVKAWTVNQARDAARLLAWGVDGLCTDDPDAIRPVLAAA